MSSTSSTLQSALFAGAGVASGLCASYAFKKYVSKTQTTSQSAIDQTSVDFPKDKKGQTHVLVVGGGNGAHVLAGYISGMENVVCNVYDSYSDEAERWMKSQEANGGIEIISAERGGAVAAKGQPRLITKDPSLVVPQAHVIMICVPAFAHESYLRSMAPYISHGTIIVALPAQSGFAECAYDCLGYELAHSCILVGYETLPWACRLKEYGTKVEVLGTKNELLIAIQGCNPDVALVKEHVRSILQEITSGPVPFPRLIVKGNLLAASLANMNQIAHPAICYGEFKDWDGKTPYPISPGEEPLFYEGMGRFAADLLTGISDEILTLRDRLLAEYPLLDLAMVRHLKDFFYAVYSDQIGDATNLQTMINTNRGYKGLRHYMVQAPMPTPDAAAATAATAIKEQEGDEGAMEEKKSGGCAVAGEATADKSAPMGMVPNFRHRYFTEDLPQGLLVTRGIAEIAGVQTPMTDEVILWSQRMVNKEYLIPVDGNGEDEGNGEGEGNGESEGRKWTLGGRDITESRAPQRYGYHDLHAYMAGNGWA